MLKTYALIGRSLEHSFSKNYFTRKFEKKLIAAQYINIELSNLDELEQCIKTQNVSGFNITIPFKERIIPFCKQIHKSAQEIGAVNCIRIDDDQWTGYNTDIMGFEKSLLNFIGNKKPKALIFGTGGASLAVQFVLSKINIEFQVVSRNDYLSTINYVDLNDEILNKHKLLINTTPVGMYPNTDAYLPIPFDEISKEHYCFDLIYNPAKTKFLTRAQDRGAKILNGKEMLEIQAEESWKIWNT